MAEPDDRYRVAMQQCEHLASEIFAERARHARELAAERTAAADARDETIRLEHRLAHAQAVIKDMERSRFWQMRLIWTRLRHRLAGRQDKDPN